MDADAAWYKAQADGLERKLAQLERERLSDRQQAALDRASLISKYERALLQVKGRCAFAEHLLDFYRRSHSSPDWIRRAISDQPLLDLTEN